jgi:hypothetical protein
MKKVLSNMSYGVGFCLLLLAFAQAQKVGATAHFDGARSPSAAAPIFSNCGAACSSYSKTGYYISGGGFQPNQGSGQAIAVGFTTKEATSFTKALTPLALTTQNGGQGSGKGYAYLLKDKSDAPGAIIGSLVQVGKLNDKSYTVIEYKAEKPIKLKAKTQYWLCLITAPNIQAIWAENSSDDNSSPIYYNNSSSCTVGMPSGTSLTAPAYAVF